MNFLAVLGLAINALWANKVRNLLTMSGVIIGVFALTLIVALGQGLNSTITDLVGSEGNLRQIRLMGGTGLDQTDSSDEIEITGEMPESRRLRLRRAALNRRRVRRSAGRSVNLITDEALNKLSQLEHVASIQPIISERYRLEVDNYSSDAVVSFGVDVDRDRYRDRIMTGKYFTSNHADEVILHEYLLYKWGLISTEEQKSILGKPLTLKTIENGESKVHPRQDNPMINDLAGGLSKEEQDAIKKLLPKLMDRFTSPNQPRKQAVREVKVIGILREFQTGEPFNVVEDTNSAQADVYLPLEVAREFFLSSSLNAELGYGSAIVIVDNAKNVVEVEQALKDLGYTAFSVVGMLEEIEKTLTIVTVIVSFLTGIAMLVSTLGIVNTMITSVLERTREIGIYKAVGATDSQVMGLFLIESAVIGLSGGLSGLAMAALATLPGNAIAARLIAEQAAISFEGSVFVMPLWLIVSGPLLGTITAVIAAYFPARRASHVDPVKALRHD